ncbi:flagellar basal-body rod modification protein FlgD [Chitinivorax tropicus]|uniref:Basal-body rod modification protein FlgD n=1 Tax=Chitinivorax tropicus TaxID=714531 RepID=A0A840MRA6_9PROT|nr:flagellar hook assembly protein FlgD [Chitinivorax tropicus]MBB5018743.1 flagellar basal-body rod modification protein FlgD [Chitinivorax tropicus]
MADVNKVSGAGAAQNNGATTTAKKTNGMEEAQDRFLKLLTTQMRNQDPLNPLDNAQVTSQMAQINTVAGITKLNESIAALSKSMMAGQAMQAASVIGRQALVPGDLIDLAGSKGAAGVNFADDVDSVTVNILNKEGKLVSSQELGKQPAGVLRLAWDGKDDKGTQLPDGPYRFEVSAAYKGKAIQATPYAFARVNSVLLADDGVKLDVGRLGSVAFADVKQIV